MNLAILLFASISACADYTPETPLDFLAEKHSPTTLSKFKKSCNVKHPLNFGQNSSSEDYAVSRAVIRGDANLLRGLIYARAHCSDGDSAESLDHILGDSLLMSYPEEMIRAFFYEHAAELGAKLVKYGKEEWIDCDSDICKKEIKDYFAEKYKKIEAQKVERKLESTKKLLLKSIENLK